MLEIKESRLKNLLNESILIRKNEWKKRKGAKKEREERRKLNSIFRFIRKTTVWFFLLKIVLVLHLYFSESDSTSKKTKDVSVEQIGRLFIFLPLPTSYSKTKSVRRSALVPVRVLPSTFPSLIAIPRQIDRGLLMATISWNGIIKRISLYPLSSFRTRLSRRTKKVIRLFRIAAYRGMKIQFPILIRIFAGLWNLQ